PALFLVPLFYKFSARFMPEMMGLFFAVASLWLLLRDRERPSLTLISASTFCLALSVLVRPYFVFWGFGIIVTLGHEAIQMRRFRMRYFIAGLAVLIPFFLWYYVYSPYLVKTYGIDYFYRGAGLRENLAVIFEARYFKDLFYNFFKVLTGWPAAPFALWALFSMKRIWRGDEGLLRLSTLGILLITLIGLALVTGRHAFIHGYYYSPLIVPSAYLLALGFQKLDLRHHKTYLVALIAIILIMQVAYLRTYRREKDVQALEELRKETNVRTRSDELFVTPELGETPLFLYVLRRKGWALRKNNLYDPEKLAGLKDKGAKWVVTFEDASPRLHSIDQWLKNIGRKDQDGAR
ncbi:MAG: hypothetical protein V3S64_08730, partial [bacterium]